jgi:hypothetical protein
MGIFPGLSRHSLLNNLSLTGGTVGSEYLPIPHLWIKPTSDRIRFKKIVLAIIP